MHACMHACMHCMSRFFDPGFSRALIRPGGGLKGMEVRQARKKIKKRKKGIGFQAQYYSIPLFLDSALILKIFHVSLAHGAFGPLIKLPVDKHHYRIVHLFFVCAILFLKSEEFLHDEICSIRHYMLVANVSRVSCRSCSIQLKKLR